MGFSIRCYRKTWTNLWANSIDKHGSAVKNPPTNLGDTRDAGLTPEWEDSLEEEIATHSRILVWKISLREESSRLQSMGSQRVRHIYTHSR